MCKVPRKYLGLRNEVTEEWRYKYNMELESIQNYKTGLLSYNTLTDRLKK
jgi:hypothetical protein